MNLEIQIPPEKKIIFFQTMIRIRLFEKKVNELFLKGHIPGTIHLYMGQEAVAVGVIGNLDKKDIIVTNHRPHGHALAKGIDPKKLMSEILGKSTGCCMGIGGSMHICDVENGIMPSNPIVGAGIPIADGLAFSNQYNKKDSVTVSFFGDATTNIGAFHEGLNLAAIWNLPVIFICENNLYGVSTSIEYSTKNQNLASKAKSYGIPGICVNGNDVEKVFLASKEAIKKARAGEGPTLIECKTYRQGGHSRNDPCTYRSRDELNKWLKKDPVVIYRKKLIKEKIATVDKLNIIEKDEQLLIDQAAEYAISSPEPNVEQVLLPFL